MTDCGVRFSMAIHPEDNDEELQFATQLGVPCVYTWVSPEQRSYDFLARLREKVELDPANPNLLLTVPGVGYRLVG